MKRESLVKALKTFLDNIDKITVTNTLKAELILSEIERLGMVPPKVISLKTYKSDNAFTDDTTSLETKYTWEDCND